MSDLSELIAHAMTILDCWHHRDIMHGVRETAPVRKVVHYPQMLCQGSLQNLPELALGCPLHRSYLL